MDMHALGLNIPETVDLGTDEFGKGKSALPATRLLRIRSLEDLLSMNTSASSIKRTAFQLMAILNLFVSVCSISAGSMPISLLVRIINGLFVYSAMHSFIVSAAKPWKGPGRALASGTRLPYARFAMEEED